MTEALAIDPHELYHYYSHISPIIVTSMQISKMYMFWIFIHYTIANAYPYFCAPSNFKGFLVSPFLVSSPHCKALRWAFDQSSLTVDNMWIIFGAWAAGKITSFF